MLMYFLRKLSFGFGSLWVEHFCRWFGVFSGFHSPSWTWIPPQKKCPKGISYSVPIFFPCQKGIVILASLGPFKWSSCRWKKERRTGFRFFGPSFKKHHWFIMSSQVLLTSFCGFPQQKTNQRKTSQKSRGPRALRSNWNWVATDLWSVPFGCSRRIPIKMFDWKGPNKTTNQWLVGDWFVCSEKKHGVLFGEMMITNHELHRIWQESSNFFTYFFENFI